MPACVAHMLIARQVRKNLAADTALATFAEILDEKARYMELGSLGPDLPYYTPLALGADETPEDECDEPAETSKWGDQLHSRPSNKFPLKMIEAIWHDSKGHWSDQDKMRFAFACGYVTHMAADQVVHPFVNRIAGPYYESPKNKHTHREVEVCQDVVLYAKVAGGDVMRDGLDAWCDPKPGSRQKTEDWFRRMIRDTFVQIYQAAPDDGDIEHWVKRLHKFLCRLPAHPKYRHAVEDYQRNGENSDTVQAYFTNIDYMRACFERAAELAAMYVMAAAKFYALEQWDDRYPEAFRRVVSDADLGDPKPEVNLEQVRKALRDWPNAAKVT
jgi:hypothetical protein